MQQGGNNRGCMMIAMIVGIGIFFLMSGGGGFLGGQPGGTEPPPQEGSAPEGSNDGGIQIVSTPQEGGLLDQVESGTIDLDGSNSTDAVDAMYDDRMVNDVHWTILEAGELGETLADGTQAQTGTFVGVVYMIENMTDAPLTLVDLQLVDSANSRYSFALETSQSLDDGCGNVTLESNSPLTCTALFVVPTTATDLNAVLTDFNMLGGTEELLDLELD